MLKRRGNDQDVAAVALSIASCFCTQYSNGGPACATCIGNAPSLVGKNSTTLFETLIADCASDSTGASAATVVQPIIKAAVLADIAASSSSSSSSSSSATSASSSANSASASKTSSALNLKGSILVAAAA
ncbi:hypothetical protein HK100_009135, partial [Physocladia obscura]